jgi:hypothetical protein
MSNLAQQRWSELFLDEEEAVEDLVRMASVTEQLCFARFGEVAAVGPDWEDALFAMRHLRDMIDSFQGQYLAAMHEINIHNGVERPLCGNHGVRDECETDSPSALDRSETYGGSVIAIPRIVKSDCPL